MENLLKDLEGHLKNPDTFIRLTALQKCLKYNEALDLFTRQVLKDKSEKLQQSAYWILQGYNPDLTEDANLPVSTDTITSIVVSPDDKYIIGGSWKIVRVWDAETGELLYKFEAHSYWVLSVAISPDGKTLITGGADCKIKIWNLKSRKCLHTLTGHSSWVNTLTVTPNGNTLVSGSSDKTIKIWDLNTGKQQHTLTEHSGWVCSVVISPDGKMLASGSTDNTIKLWDLNSGKLLQTLEEHSDWVQTIVISSDGDWLISGSRNGEIKFWQNNFSNPIKDNSDQKINISKFLLLAISLLSKKFIGIVNIILAPLLFERPNLRDRIKTNQNFKYIQTIDKSPNQITNLKLTLDRKTLVIGQSDCIILLQNTETEKSWTAHSSFISSLVIFKENQRLISASLDWIKIWDIETKESIYIFQGSSKPELSQIKIVKYYKVLEVGKNYNFKVKGLDQYNKEIEIDKPVIWKATDGRIDSSTGQYITSKQEGKVTVTATVGRFLEDSICVEVIDPPRLDDLIITPSFVSLLYFESKKLTVKGLDQRDETFKLETVSWTATGGTIENGIYTAGNNEGTFKITAKSGNISKNVTVKVFAPPKLTTLEIYPSSVKLEFGETTSFKVKGFDQYKQIININEIGWHSSHGKINEDGKFTASHQAEIVRITATVEGKKAFIDVTVVEPLHLEDLEIDPASIILNPGQTHKFAIKGLDQKGNEFPVESVYWKATGGEINQQGCFTVHENAKGSFKITAYLPSFNLQASAKFSVPPILKKLLISPETISVEPNQSVQFYVIGFDQTGDLFALNNVNWSCSPGGEINSDGIFTGGYQKRDVTVTANVGSIHINASVTLLPVLQKIKIFPSQGISLEPDEHQQFTAIGLDQFESEIDPGLITWEATGGTINQQGYYTAGYNSKGVYTVKAKTYDIPKYDIKVKLFLWGYYLKIFLQILKQLQQVYSWGTRLEHLADSSDNLKKTPQLDEEYENQNEEETFLSKLNFDSDTSIFELNIQSWILKAAIKLIFQILDWIANRCIEASTISDSVKVKIIPVVRKLDISSQTKQLQTGEQCTLIVKGYDQTEDLIEVNNIEWKSKGGQIHLNKDYIVKHQRLNSSISIENSDFITEFIFLAGDVEGDFKVEAKSGKCEGSISIKISNTVLIFCSPPLVPSFEQESSSQPNPSQDNHTQQPTPLVQSSEQESSSQPNRPQDNHTQQPTPNPQEKVEYANNYDDKISHKTKLDKLEFLEIYLPKNPLILGRTYLLIVRGRSVYGYEVELEEVNWTVDEGWIDTDGSFLAWYQAQNHGEFEITATVNDISCSVFVEVSPSSDGSSYNSVRAYYMQESYKLVLLRKMFDLRGRYM